MKFFILILILSLSTFAADKSKEKRGLLPELKLDDKNEEKNEVKQLTSELMIARAEDKAITSLQALLNKNRNTPQEADLLYRLAELYMRKSKTGRFFDLNINSKTLKLSPFPIPPQKGKDWIRKASNTYYEIERRFPQFPEMDGVLFNNAFASQQIGDLKGAETLYRKLLTKYPNSPLVPDGLIALGELLYDQARFKDARESFEKIENFPQSRIYSYGLYKWAWTLYNIKLSDPAIKKLVEVVERNPLRLDQTKSYNLRKEALRDLVLFVGDVLRADELYTFFKKLTSEDELGEAIINLAKLYQSYNREKDMHIFLNEFLKKSKDHSYHVKAHMFLVEANENLKRRDEVLSNLELAGKLCEPDAIWRAKQDQTWAQETCASDFRKTSLEIAKKWWEIWLKNKNHVEFSKLTEKALRMVLKNDDPQKPDYKTRYALAELLFQQGQYDEASQHYETVGTQAAEPTMVHDADYGALYSVQKSIEKEKSKAKQERLKNRSLYYIQKHPKGPHSLAVQLQVALAEYEINNDQESEKYLIPLTQQNSNSVVRLRAQDLMLDIYNLRKDYPKLKALASQYLQEATALERKQSLQKIYEEAHYSDVQGALKSKPKIEVAEMLLDFRKTHPQSKLSREALWQALSLAYSEGFTYRGAVLSNEFAVAYPDDKRSSDALKESASSFLQTGRIEEALEIYQKLLKAPGSDKAKIRDILIDLYILENKRTQAREILRQEMKSATGSEKQRLFDRLTASFSESEKSSSEYKQFEEQLVSQGVEPYSTRFLTRQSRQAFEAKNYSQAFQTATKAVARDSALEHRAEARYIQARILEQELVNQSVKTTKEDRLSTVLNIKTERLEKALTAYNSAAKMAKDPQLALQILEGIDRSYGNYISSLRNMELPASLSEADQKTLRKEIENITVPIETKQNENKEAIVALMKKTPTAAGETQWADLRVEETAPVRATGPTVQELRVFLPDSWKASSSWSLHKNKKPSCKADAFKKDTDFGDRAELMADCFLAQNWKMFENEALALTDTPTNRAWGLFYLSLASEKKGLLDKAFWLNEKALASETQNEIFQYQRARLMAQIDGLNASLSEFNKLFLSTKISTDELEALKAIHHSHLGDWKTTKEILSRFSTDKLYKLNLLVLYAEAQNKTGNVDEAVSLISNSKLKNSLEGWLYLAKIFEVDKPELVKAVDSYKKALSLTRSAELKTWLEKKVDYLNSLKK